MLPKRIHNPFNLDKDIFHSILQLLPFRLQVALRFGTSIFLSLSPINAFISIKCIKLLFWVFIPLLFAIIVAITRSLRETLESSFIKAIKKGIIPLELAKQLFIINTGRTLLLFIILAVINIIIKGSERRVSHWF